MAILINNNFEYKILKNTRDEKGNFLNLLLKLSSLTINIITLYGPNNDCLIFFEEIEKLIENTNADYNILCGDFNIALNQENDTFNYRHTNNP